jgi:PAS domain S-box-containing protein
MNHTSSPTPMTDEINRLETVMNTVLDGLLIINERGTIERFNKAAERIFGYSADEVIGKNVKMLMPDPYHSQHDGYLTHYLSTGEKKVIGIGREVEAKRKDGSVFSIELGVNEMNLDGARMFMGTIRDITSRKEAEYQHEEEAARFSAVVNTVLDGVITINYRGIIQSFNPAAVRIFGYSPKEVIGRNIKMLMPEPYYSEHDGYLKNFLSTGEKKVIGVEREVEAKRKDGSIFPIELGVNEMLVQGQRMFVGTIRDITERKEAEKEIESYLEKFKHSNQELDDFAYILEKSLNEIYIFDPETLRFMYVNKGARDNIGYSMQELSGLTPIDIKPDYSAASFRAALQPLFSNDSEKLVIKTRHQRKNGSTYDVEMHLQLSYFQKQRAFVAIILDVTAREKLIERLTESNEQLERFAYVCSHDLQEPLRMVRSFSEKLEEHLKGRFDDDEKGRKYFRFVIDGAARAQALIEDILAYSSIDNDAQKLQTFSVNELIENITESMMLYLEEHGGRITQDELPMLHGNKTQMFQLFQNLINNGIKYQKPGNAPHVHVGVTDAGTHWQFAVKDNGIGIEKRHLPKIFNIFQRLHKKTDYAGTGIGLSICKKVVERHGGTIWVESNEGEGSSFYFTILKSSHTEFRHD